MRPITILAAWDGAEAAGASLSALAADPAVAAVVLLAAPEGPAPPDLVGGRGPRVLRSGEPGGHEVLGRILAELATPFLLRVDPGAGLAVAPRTLERMLSVAGTSGTSLVYADYLEDLPAGPRACPLADYQTGSLPEGFRFGPLVLWSREAMARARAPEGGAVPGWLRYHAWYDLRLRASLAGPILRLPEPLALRRPPERRSSGQAVFDYLTAGRDAQKEAEEVATAHLRRLGACLAPPFLPFTEDGSYPVEASVVIPVRNRVGTVGDAVASALGQSASFAFNVIVVDNHSTDGTTELLAGCALQDGRLVHHVPASPLLGIGGCWNEAVFHPACGRYAVQLDSDDLYASPHALATLIGALRETGAGMAIGSYTTVDRSLAPVPPGLIDHREWSDHNGPNNALRIEGLGAPRAFATALVRRHPFPNVSYGEDYAVALRISREYRVARIYEPVYLCRRWEGNTDADLAPEALARHHLYKDRLRSLEIEARRRCAATGAAEAEPA